MTIKGNDHHDQDLEIHFVQGKFALPYSNTSHTARSRAASVLSAAKVSLQKTLSSDSSTWSESDESSKSSDHDTGNLIIGGGDDDLPREAPEGTVGLVGGTFVVQGVSNPNERDAIAKTLQYLVSAIHTVVAYDSYTLSNPSRSNLKYLMHSGSLARVTRHSTTRLPLAQRSRTLYEGHPSRSLERERGVYSVDSWVEIQEKYSTTSFGQIEVDWARNCQKMTHCMG